MLCILVQWPGSSRQFYEFPNFVKGRRVLKESPSNFKFASTFSIKKVITYLVGLFAFSGGVGGTAEIMALVGRPVGA